MPYQAPPPLATLSLADIAEAVAARRLPPLAQWAPARSIESGMRIAANGQWFHEGRPITRPAMTRAFSSLLMKDETGQHWLMTPDCRQRIAVEDAAFVAVDLAIGEGQIAFALNTDELVIAGPANPLRAAGDADCPAIYLSVRHGCEARLNRSTWLALADHALAGAGGAAGKGLFVHSAGARFALIPR